MTIFKLAIKSLCFYWRTNLAVLAAVVVSVAVLAGALAVGDSVENSLKMMVDSRLGDTQFALITQERFFTDQLADKLAVCPILQLRALITNSDGSERINRVELLGVDSRFYEIGRAANPFAAGENNGVVINEAVARRLGVEVGDEVLLRLARPSLMSREIVLMPESDSSIGFRFKVTAIAGKSEFGLFSLLSNHLSALNVFIPLEQLQEKLDQPGRANVLLVGAGRNIETANDALKDSSSLADIGLELRESSFAHTLELRSSRVFMKKNVGNDADGILTYFVNELRTGEKTTPYSMVTAMSDSAHEVIPADMADDEIVINKWLADDLAVKVGNQIELDYFVVSDMRRLIERTSSFRVCAVVPIEGLASDPELMPDFPGLADVNNCRDWEPGIPIDLDKIRDKDEDYWQRFHGTPKAFVTLKAGQKIWGNRYGNLTAVRYRSTAGRAELTEKILSGIESGLYFQPVRNRSVKASGEGTDFGQLFVGFSMFIIAAALILVGLLFIFGVEKRSSELGMLLAIGFKPAQIKRLFLIEAAVLAVVGSIAGTIVGLAYTKAMVYGLTSLWSAAISGSSISFYVSWATLLKASASGVVVSMAVICMALRKRLKKQTSQLLDENLQWQFFTSKQFSKYRASLTLAVVAMMAAIVLLVVFGTGGREAAAVFFGAGASLLLGSIALVNAFLKIATGGRGKAAFSLAGLGLRNATRRSSRSLAAVAMLACGVFLVIAVGANRSAPSSSGTGGFDLFGESAIGIPHDLNSQAGRESLGFEQQVFTGADFVQLRVRDGDDASCFNLNRAQQPRLLGVESGKLRDRFLFTKQLEEKAWELLDIDLGENVVPAIGDEATVRWALGKSIGDRISYTDENGRQFELQLVGTIKNSILQGSLLISEGQFIKRFPSEDGYPMMLVETENSKAVSAMLSQRLIDSGLELTGAGDRLAAFAAVEHTYLSIFQLLGSFGIVLGSLGLGVVVLRNVLDRRGELAMMRALGFDRGQLKRMVFYEHIALLLFGLFFGTVSALAAISGVLKEPGSQPPYLELIITIVVIAVSGIIWVWAGASIALSGTAFDALRSE
ncbi:FtsX-like permease family protein [Planctomycetota bacterium]